MTENNNLSEFGRKCRAVGLTAYRIAKDTGANLQTVTNWMNGAVKPMLSDQLLSVLKYCNENGANVRLEDLKW